MVYLHGIMKGFDEDMFYTRFRILHIPFRSLNDLEKFRMSRARKFNCEIFTYHSHSLKSELAMNKPKYSVEQQKKIRQSREATDIAEAYIKGHSKTSLAEILDIQRVTLNTRLEKHNWKKGEIFILKRL